MKLEKIVLRSVKWKNCTPIFTPFGQAAVEPPRSEPLLAQRGYYLMGVSTQSAFDGQMLSQFQKVFRMSCWTA